MTTTRPSDKQTDWEGKPAMSVAEDGFRVALALADPRIAHRVNRQPTLGSGAKLLCVDDSGLARSYNPGPVTRGRIYCVRELYKENGIPGVLLVGIVGPLSNNLECGFLLSRFRWVRD